ncbi:homeobox protein hhex [Anaeramoeba flamelloides]|uniref:Homeobox protein hhex n=1 Tax=Anaeramoeba flamelloides TaxID=1746091 RepID=A0AAV8A3N1_9EUKA|nr:homeobox protein hhex [Anaeramoeba flamelloides]
MNNHNKLKQDLNSPLANNNTNSLLSNTQISTPFRMSPHPIDSIPLDTNENQLQILSFSRTTSYDLLSQLINNGEIIPDQGRFDEFDYSFDGNDLDSMEINSSTTNPTLGLHNFSQTLRDDNIKFFPQNKDQLHSQPQKHQQKQQRQQKKSFKQEQPNLKQIELNPQIFEPIDTTDLFFNDKNNFATADNNQGQNKIDFDNESIFSLNSIQSPSPTQITGPNQNTINCQTGIQIKKDKDQKSPFISSIIKNFSFNNRNELVSMENCPSLTPLTNSFEKKLLDPEFDQIMEFCDQKRKTKIVQLKEQYEFELNELNQAKKRYMKQMVNMSTPVEDVIKNKGGIEKIQEKFDKSFSQLNQTFKNELNQIKKETLKKKTSKSKLSNSNITENEYSSKDHFQISRRKRNYPKQLNSQPTNYKIKKSNLKIIQTKSEIINDSKQEKKIIPKTRSQLQSRSKSRSRSPLQSAFEYETQTNERSQTQLYNTPKDLRNKKQTKKKSRKKRKKKSKPHRRSKKKSSNLKKPKLKRHHNGKDKNNSLIKPKSSKLMLKRRRRCKRLRTTELAKNIFEKWFQDHYNDEGGPYPSKEIRLVLAEKSQIPELQVQRWFGQRRRIEKDKFKNSEIGKPKWV